MKCCELWSLCKPHVMTSPWIRYKLLSNIVFWSCYLTNSLFSWLIRWFWIYFPNIFERSCSWASEGQHSCLDVSLKWLVQVSWLQQEVSTVTALKICLNSPLAFSFATTCWELLVLHGEKAWWWKASCHGAKYYLPVGVTINLGCLPEMEPRSRSRFNDLWAVITPVTFGCFILMKYSHCSSQNGSIDAHQRPSPALLCLICGKVAAAFLVMLRRWETN